jgi:hypothetical protein
VICTTPACFMASKKITQVEELLCGKIRCVTLRGAPRAHHIKARRALTLHNELQNSGLHDTLHHSWHSISRTNRTDAFKFHVSGAELGWALTGQPTAPVFERRCCSPQVLFKHCSIVYKHIELPLLLNALCQCVCSFHGGQIVCVCTDDAASGSLLQL